MDRTHERSTWLRTASRLCLTATLAALSCAQEDHPIGTPEVRVRQEQRDVLASAKILRNGEEIGALRTLRVRSPGRERVLHHVQDLHMNSLGYIDEQNCAWRLTAHTGSELVASSSDQRRNVAAILGSYGASIEIVDEAPAAATGTDRAPASRPARSR